jgi:hypothetical protein
MGTFNLAINYPDAQAARIMTALRTHWTTTVDGVPVVPTNAQAIEKLRLAVAENVKDIVQRVERDAAVKTASDGIAAVDAT